MEDDAKKQAPEQFPLSIKLAKLISHGGREILEVVVREPTGRDWKRWCGQPDTPARTMGLLMDLTGLEEAVFDAMPMRDHARCIEAAAAFFARYQPEENGVMQLLMTSPSFMAGLQKQLMD